MNAVGAPQHAGIAPAVLVDRLARSPVLSRCSRSEVARLVPFLRLRHLEPGEALARAGQPADDLWLLVQGMLRVKREDGSFHDVGEGLIGEEAALGVRCYLADIVAVDGATVAAVARGVLPVSLTDQSPRVHAFGRSLIQTFAPAAFSEATIERDTDEPAPRTSALRIAGWIAAIVAPLALFQLVDDSPLKWEQRQLAAVLTSTAMLWSFGSVPPFVAALLVVLTCVTLGLVPTGVVLSGFASNGFFLALSAFSLGAVLIESGAIDRVFRLFVRRCPPAAVCYDLAAFFFGVLLTPVVPSALDRSRTLAPLLTESAATLGYAPDSREWTGLTLSTWIGLSAFSPMFLTGGPMNMILYGSLPEQIEDAFPSLRWAAAASVAMLVLFAAFLAMYWLVRGRHKSRQSTVDSRQSTIAAQLALLGPVKPKEWLAAGGVVLFLGAVATVSLHKIDHRLLALTIVCGYLVLGTLGKEELNLRIDWSGLILLGALIGVIAAMIHAGLHAAMAERLVELSDMMKYRPKVFVALLAAVVVAANLWIPMAGALVAVAAVPLAVFNGMNPWVVVFVILLMSDVNVWPHQSEPYRTFRRLVGRDQPLDEPLFARFNIGMSAARLLALAASVPFWEYLKVL